MTRGRKHGANWLRAMAISAAIVLVSSSCSISPGASMAPSKPPAQVNLGEYASVQDRLDQDSDLAVAVAISGGGHRAGHFAVGVLIALQMIPYAGRDVLREVDYFSTASGGGFAAATYIAARHAHASRKDDTSEFDYARALNEGCEPASDAATAPVGTCLRAGLYYNYEWELYKRFYWPSILFTPLTSGDALETAFDDRLLGRLRYPETRLTLGTMFVRHGEKPKLPYWVANATIYENGAIFPFVPGVLREYKVNCWHHRMHRERCHNNPADLPLSVALKASASFPVLIPLTVLGTSRKQSDRYLRLADGGQADNLGVHTAIELLKQDKRATRKVLLIVDAYPGTGSPYSSTPRSALPLPVFRRAADIALDSFHGLHLSLVKALVESDKIAVISLTFSVLRDDHESRPVPECEVLDKRARPKRPGERNELWQSARSVGTLLRIKPSEARDLARAAEIAVARRCPQIVGAMRGESGQPSDPR